MKSIDKFIPILNQTSLRSIIVATFGAPIVFHGTVVFFKLTRLLLLRFKLRPRFSNKMMFDFNPSFEMQNIWSYRVQFLILLESGFFIWYIVMFRWLWGLQPHSRINIFARHWRYFKAHFFIQELPHHGNGQKSSAHDSRENCHRYIHHMVFQGIYHDIAWKKLLAHHVVQLKL